MTQEQTLPVADAEGMIGVIEPQIREAIVTLQAQTRDLTFQVGQLELRKAQVIATLTELNMRAQALVNAEAKRLGIPDGAPWQITAEGKARLLTPAPEAG